jgi:hypothetical protein
MLQEEMSDEQASAESTQIVGDPTLRLNRLNHGGLGHHGDRATVTLGGFPLCGGTDLACI